MGESAKTLPHGTETILIVDDHETIWDFLIDALQKLGYSVLLAENGLDAVEIYESNPREIDLVLLDMIMPKAGGHQTFYRLRAIDPDAKVLLSSGFVLTRQATRRLSTNGAARCFTLCTSDILLVCLRFGCTGLIGIRARAK